MAIKQTRRSVSMSRKLYEQAKLVAASEGMPLAQLVELAVRSRLGDPNFPKHFRKGGE